MSQDEPPAHQYKRTINTQARKGPVVVKAEELLADGEWHNYERIMSQLIRLVKPGPAARRAETMRTAVVHGARPAPDKRVRPRELDAQIRAGARAIVKDHLRHSHFEIEPKGRLDDPTTRLIRFNPPTPKRQLIAEDFTHSQLSCLAMFADGWPTLDISVKLGLRTTSKGDNGARSLCYVITKKLDVDNMPAAVLKARQIGLISQAPPLEGIDRGLATLMVTYSVNNINWWAEKLGVDAEEAAKARRRLMGRAGVNTFPELKAALAENEVVLGIVKGWSRDGNILMHPSDDGLSMVAMGAMASDEIAQRALELIKLGELYAATRRRHRMDLPEV